MRGSALKNLVEHYDDIVVQLISTRSQLPCSRLNEGEESAEQRAGFSKPKLGDLVNLPNTKDNVKRIKRAIRAFAGYDKHQANPELTNYFLNRKRTKTNDDGFTEVKTSGLNRLTKPKEIAAALAYNLFHNKGGKLKLRTRDDPYNKISLARTVNAQSDNTLAPEANWSRNDLGSVKPHKSNLISQTGVMKRTMGSIGSKSPFKDFLTQFLAKRRNLAKIAPGPVKVLRQNNLEK